MLSIGFLCGVLQQRVYSRKIQTVGECHDQLEINNSQQWHRHLHSCGAVKGGYLGQSLCNILQKVICCMTNSFCVNNDLVRFSAIFIGIFHDFGRFSMIFIGIFLILACSVDVLETLRIIEIDRERC